MLLAVVTVPAAQGGKGEGRIGRSIEGRAIVAQSWGEHDAERRVLVVGSIHGDEAQGERIVTKLTGRPANRLHDVELWTVETLNPDGVAAHRRGNAHGVDLNRNFPWNWRAIPRPSGYYSGPGPASEPETRAARRFLRQLRPDLTIYYHQPWNRVLVPCGSGGRRIARRYAELSGMATGRCDPSPPGSATGYQRHRLGEKAFVVELPGRALRDSEVRRHARAVLAVARG